MGLLTELKVVTSNPDKWLEISEILGGVGVRCRWVRMSLPEIQSDDLREIAEFSAAEAHKRLGGGVIVEDAGLFIEALTGFPGPYSSYVYKTLGLRGILKLLDGEENRGAVFRSVVCMVTEGGEKIVAEGEVKGVITREPRGSGGFGFDPIFAPAGAGGKTFAEMTRDEKNRLSHRGAAVRGLLRQIVGQP